MIPTEVPPGKSSLKSFAKRFSVPLDNSDKWQLKPTMRQCKCVNVGMARERPSTRMNANQALGGDR